MTNDILIFFTGLVAAFVGALVGGGGLISIPLLTVFGLPIQVAITTNKVGGFGLCIGAMIKYWKEKKIDWKLALQLILISIPAVFIGTKILIEIDKTLLSRIVGVILLLILPFVIFQKKLLAKSKNVSKKHTLIGHVLYFFISIYSSFFGGGTGIFARAIFLFFYKKGMVESNATDLVVGLACNILTVVILAGAGYINLRAAIVLFLGMLIGGYFGAHTAVKKGDEWVKLFYILLILTMGVKLIFFS